MVVGQILEPEGSSLTRKTLKQMAEEHTVYFDTSVIKDAQGLRKHWTYWKLAKPPSQDFVPRRPPVWQPRGEHYNQWVKDLTEARLQQWNLQWYRDAIQELDEVYHNKRSQWSTTFDAVKHMRWSEIPDTLRRWRAEANDIARKEGETKRSDTGYGFGVAFFHPGLDC